VGVEQSETDTAPGRDEPRAPGEAPTDAPAPAGAETTADSKAETIKDSKAETTADRKTDSSADGNAADSTADAAAASTAEARADGKASDAAATPGAKAGPGAEAEQAAGGTLAEKVGEALDVVSADIKLERDGDGFLLTNDQVQRTEGLPSFAKKIAGDTTRVIQTEEWASPSGPSPSSASPRTRSSMSGTIELVPDGAGTLEVVELEIKARVPLVGGKLEGLMAEQVREGMDTERKVGRAWLTGDRA